MLKGNLEVSGPPSLFEGVADDLASERGSVALFREVRKDDACQPE